MPDSDPVLGYLDHLSPESYSHFSALRTSFYNTALLTNVYCPPGQGVCTTTMSVARLLKKFGQTSLTRSTSSDGRSGPSTDDPNKLPHQQQARKPTLAFPHPLRKKRSSTTDHFYGSRPKSTSSLSPEAEDPTSEHEVHETSPQMPLPTTSTVFLSTVEPPPEIIPAVVPLPDKLTEVWNIVKDNPNVVNSSPGIHSVGTSSVFIQFSVLCSFWSCCYDRK